MIRGSRLTDRASRGSARERKRLKKLNKWPSFYDHKIDLLRIDRAQVGRWIEDKVTALLGFEDEVLVGTIQNTIMDSKDLDPLKVQNTLEPFLAEKTHDFMKELWAKLLVYQSDKASNLGLEERTSEPAEDFLAKYEKERTQVAAIAEKPATTGDSRKERVSRDAKDVATSRTRRRSSSSSSESSHERRARRRRRRRRNRDRSSSSD